LVILVNTFLAIFSQLICPATLTNDIYLPTVYNHSSPSRHSPNTFLRLSNSSSFSHCCLCLPTITHLFQMLNMPHNYFSHLPTAAYFIPPPPISSYRCLCHPTASHLVLPLPMLSHRLPSRPTAAFVIPPPPMSSYLCPCHPTASHLFLSLPMSSHRLPSRPTATYVIPLPPISSYRCLCHPTASYLFLLSLCHPTACHVFLSLPVPPHRLPSRPTAAYVIPLPPMSSYRCLCHPTASHVFLPLPMSSHRLLSLPTVPMSSHRLPCLSIAACVIPPPANYYCIGRSIR